MGQLTRQEVQTMLDTLRTRSLDKMVTRQDVQSLTEATRDKVMTYTHDLVQIHQQNMMRRQDVQNSQLTKRIAVMETRMITLEQEIRLVRQVLERIASQTPATAGQHIRMPAQSSTPPEQRYTSYLYQPE